MRSTLKENKGIDNVKTDLHNHTIDITFDDKLTNIDKIKKIIESAGFKIVK